MLSFSKISRASFVLLLLCFVGTSMLFGQGFEVLGEKEVEKGSKVELITKYIAALKEKDAEGIKAIASDTFMKVTIGNLNKNDISYFIDSEVGNKDFEKPIKFKFKKIEVEGKERYDCIFRVKTKDNKNSGFNIYISKIDGKWLLD